MDATGKATRSAKSGLGRFLGGLTRVFYPPVCLVCRAPGDGDLDLCAACRADLPWSGHACPACARPLPRGSGPLCGACLKHPPPFDVTRALLRYAPPVDRLIAGLKYQGRLNHARVLGALWAQSLPLSGTAPEALLPVPLHEARLRERGFNQALELARPLGRRLDVPVMPDVIERTRPTRAQQGLKGRERRRNVRGAFRVRVASLPGRVALIDDVMTTGSTVTEIARILKRAGVARVEVWVLARA